jgi:ubiquinone/menaquinone biosynthesis C-methylase UbiE
METRNFDKEAAAWDTPMRISLARDIAAAVLQRVSPGPHMDVLDFGCGTGLVSLLVAPFVRTITALDSSEGMLAVLREKARLSGIGNLEAVQADLTKGEQLEGVYDLVVSSMTLHHIQDIARLLAQFKAVLRPGGRIALADLDEEDGLFHADNTGVFHHGFKHEKLTVVLQEAGFSEISFSSAARVTRPAGNGAERIFGIFLVTAKV